MASEVVFLLLGKTETQRPLWGAILPSVQYLMSLHSVWGKEKKGFREYIPTYLYMAESTVDYVLQNDPSRAHFTKEHVEPGKASCHNT
jgi:hypothetical protein